MKKCRAILFQFRQSSSGNSILEAAIVLPLAAALMIGIVDFGLAYRTRAIAEKSMQNAARYLSTLPPSALCDWGWKKARYLAVTGVADETTSNPPLISGWTVEKITLETDPPCTQNPTTFKTIDLHTEVPYTPVFWNSVITMKASHRETWIGQ